MESRESVDDLPNVTCSRMVSTGDVTLNDNLLKLNPQNVNEEEKVEHREEKFDPANFVISTNGTAPSSATDPMYTLHAGLVVNRGLVFPITDVNGQLTLGTLTTSSENPDGTLPQSLLSTYLLQGTENGSEIATQVSQQGAQLTVVPPGERSSQLLPLDGTNSLTVSDKPPITVEFINGSGAPVIIAPRENTVKMSPNKRKGGWPKGKKRKKEVISLPKAPVTGYVLYAMERREQLKITNPELLFVDATRLMGMEWTSMPSKDKEKYLERAQEDKRRYAEELKEYQKSEEYQLYIKEKRIKDGLSPSEVDDAGVSVDFDMLVDDSLHCRICDMYFTSQHNMKEHLFGRQHLQNLTNDFHEDLQKKEADKERERQLLLDSQAVAIGLSPVHHTEERSVSRPSTNHTSCVCGREQFGISAFIQLFMEKQNDMEFERQELRQIYHEIQTQNELLLQRFHFLKQDETRILQELETLKKIGAAISAQIDGLKIVPQLFQLSNF